MPEPQNSLELSEQRADRRDAADRIGSLPLARMATSVLMGVLFFVILTPIAFVVRFAGREPLELRIDRDRPSYWRSKASRGQRQASMTKQY